MDSFDVALRGGGGRGDDAGSGGRADCGIGSARRDRAGGIIHPAAMHVDGSRCGGDDLQGIGGGRENQHGAKLADSRAIFLLGVFSGQSDAAQDGGAGSFIAPGIFTRRPGRARWVGGDTY